MRSKPNVTGRRRLSAGGAALLVSAGLAAVAAVMSSGLASGATQSAPTTRATAGAAAVAAGATTPFSSYEAEAGTLGGGATVASGWWLRSSALATKPVAFISSTNVRRYPMPMSRPRGMPIASAITWNRPSITRTFGSCASDSPPPRTDQQILHENGGRWAKNLLPLNVSHDSMAISASVRCSGVPKRPRCHWRFLVFCF